MLVITWGETVKEGGPGRQSRSGERRGLRLSSQLVGIEPEWAVSGRALPWALSQASVAVLLRIPTGLSQSWGTWVWGPKLQPVLSPALQTMRCPPAQDHLQMTGFGQWRNECDQYRRSEWRKVSFVHTFWQARIHSSDLVLSPVGGNKSLKKWWVKIMKSESRAISPSPKRVCEAGGFTENVKPRDVTGWRQVAFHCNVKHTKKQVKHLSFTITDTTCI